MKRWAELIPNTLVNGQIVVQFEEWDENHISQWTAFYKTELEAIREIGLFLYQDIYKEMARR